MKKLSILALIAITSLSYSTQSWNMFNQSMHMSIHGVTVTSVMPSAGFVEAYDVSFVKGAYFTLPESSTKYYIDYIKGFYVVTNSEKDYLGVPEYLNAKLHEPQGPDLTDQPLAPNTTYGSNVTPFNLVDSERWHSNSTSTYGNGAISGNFAGWGISQTPNGEYSLFSSYTEEFEYTNLNFKHAPDGVNFGLDVSLLQENVPGYTVNKFPGSVYPYQGYIINNPNLGITPGPSALIAFILPLLRKRNWKLYWKL